MTQASTESRRRFIPGAAGTGSLRTRLIAASVITTALAVAAMLSLPGLLFPGTRLVAPALVLLVALIQSPMAARLVRRTRRLRYAWFVPMSVLRACARGVGLAQGALSLLHDRPEPHPRSA